ncbi:hypothetical protein KY285_010395 [Solanum tuberosum]|nr:hypothetical protein KY289_012747 [Solanum tuberosum]KAH0734688.1 hypothetical protein KY285_010395 [Solanum tuberosum]
MQDVEVMFGMVGDGTSVLLPNAKSMDLFARQTLIFNLTGWFPTEDCFQALATQDWGAATLSYLYHSLYRASICDVSVVNGFISLLQVWVWERIIPFQPMISPFNNDQLEGQKPFAYKSSRRRVHDNEARKNMILCRDVLDNLLPYQFIWEPYSQEVLNALPEWCRRGHNVWMVKVPLIFGIYHEWHMVDRVAMGHERLYRMNQAIENDNTQSFQVRDNARQMTSYSRDAMNAAHLNTRLNFQQHYTPPNENQSPTTSNSGGVHIEEHNTEFSGNQYEANTNLSLATPDTPYYPIFYCAGVSTSVPNYTEEEGSGFQTPNVVNLGFEGFNEGNYGFVRQCQFQNSPFQAGRLSFFTDYMSQNQNGDEVGPSQQYDINNPQRTTRPHVPTTCGTSRHKQQQQPHQDRQ